MTQPQLPVDQNARDAALDANQSFIVQAPAGSGKTSLLTQRFLKLLANVNNPEEVLAITFTRKAAAEMKNRLLESLQLAKQPEPEQSYLKTTWKLATKVLKRDQQLNWGLQQHSARLRIQTIDSLCASLNRQLPILSGIGGNLTLLERAEEYYLQAAENTVLLVEDAEYTPALLPLVSHLDGNLPRIQRLIASMLGKRLNWAGVTGVSFQREALDLAWTDWIERRISHLSVLMENFRVSLQPLWQYSCNQLATMHPDVDHPNGDDWDMWSKQHWPENDLASLNSWKKLADLLLTGKNEFRKTITKKHGFVAESSTKDPQQKALYAEKKSQFIELLEALSDAGNAHNEELLEALAAIKILPHPGFNDEHWYVLESLGVALKLALAQLWIIFDENSVIDFPEITIRSQQALGSPEEPTDLALRLDYQISHILVDEFQDTSQSQRSLLRQLTAGWQLDDARTLFVVGDPMQSIYRFRAAEVSIFLEAWHHQQLAGIPLQQLTLSTNFRSEKGIVDWVNSAFENIFPEHDDDQLGAVRYSHSEAMDQTLKTNAITVLPLSSRDDEQEAEWVVNKISAIRNSDHQQSCAILVRSKAHLEYIAPKLREQGIPFEAVDIESLILQPVVQDLYSLTAAMLDDSDRLHWLAILRAPWCGLALSDLTLLVAEREQLIPELLNNADYWQHLSEDGQQRLQKISVIIADWMRVKGQKDLASWIETLWLALQGAAATSACVNNNALEDANTYFQLLSSLSSNGQFSLSDLYLAVKDLYAKPEQGQSNPVYLMSMHKSKGLEFDHVFLPGLGRRTKAEDQNLLEWMEWPKPEGDVDLLLAPIKGAHEDHNAFYKVLQDINKQKSKFENQRLLYVAVTRAKQCLYFCGHIKDADAKKPEANSLLNLLWSKLSNQFDFIRDEQSKLSSDQSELSENPLMATLARLDLKSKLIPTENNYFEDTEIELNDNTEIQFEWASERARVVGVVAHKLMQWLPTMQHLPKSKLVEKLTPWFSIQLKSYGLDNKQTSLAVTKLLQLTENTLSSERGRWILDSNHLDGKCEWALESFNPQLVGTSQRLIIDRSFIDENGIRWIIDYKTGSHEGSDKQAFLDSEKIRYQPQLEKYGRAVACFEKKPIRLGIYFPAMDEWIEWPSV